MRPEGVEPPRVAPRDPKSRASASSATVACRLQLMRHAPGVTGCSVAAAATHMRRVAELQHRAVRAAGRGTRPLVEIPALDPGVRGEVEEPQDVDGTVEIGLQAFERVRAAD